MAAWPAWLPTVSRVEPQSAAQLALGARFTVHQPRLRPTVWSVVALEPGRHFSWRSVHRGLTMVADHTIAEQAAGGSRVVLTFRLRGLLAPLVALLAGGLVRHYLAVEATSLCGLAERGARMRLRRIGHDALGSTGGTRS